MAKVKVLVEGYAKELKNGWKASSTVTLIEDGDKKIIVDPGINKRRLLNSLRREKLTTSDIDIVFLTHYHIDHAFLAALFENSIVMDGDIIYEGDKETEYKGKIPGTEVEVMLSPGHSHEHASLLLETDKGRVVIAGDVFWWMENEKQDTSDPNELLKRDDPFVKNKKEIVRSRKKLLKRADWIIPGHGKMFRV
jgi:glyoxylase-like metal-dependent hydrolase (beta-lactamase superfamily II)